MGTLPMRISSATTPDHNSAGRDQRLIQLIMLMKAIDDEEDRFALAKAEHKDARRAEIAERLADPALPDCERAERVTIGAGGVTRSTVSAEAWCALRERTLWGLDNTCNAEDD